jgi:hypothetical protein
MVDPRALDQESSVLFGVLPQGVLRTVLAFVGLRESLRVLAPCCFRLRMEVGQTVFGQHPDDDATQPDSDWLFRDCCRSPTYVSDDDEGGEDEGENESLGRAIGSTSLPPLWSVRNGERGEDLSCMSPFVRRLVFGCRLPVSPAAVTSLVFSGRWAEAVILVNAGCDPLRNPVIMADVGPLTAALLLARDQIERPHGVIRNLEYPTEHPHETPRLSAESRVLLLASADFLSDVPEIHSIAGGVPADSSDTSAYAELCLDLVQRFDPALPKSSFARQEFLLLRASAVKSVSKDMVTALPAIHDAVAVRLLKHGLPGESQMQLAGEGLFKKLGWSATLEVLRTALRLPGYGGRGRAKAWAGVALRETPLVRAFRLALRAPFHIQRRETPRDAIEAAARMARVCLLECQRPLSELECIYTQLPADILHFAGSVRDSHGEFVRVEDNALLKMIMHWSFALESGYDPIIRQMIVTAGRDFETALAIAQQLVERGQTTPGYLDDHVLRICCNSPEKLLTYAALLEEHDVTLPLSFMKTLKGYGINLDDALDSDILSEQKD